MPETMAARFELQCLITQRNTEAVTPRRFWLKTVIGRFGHLSVTRRGR